MHINRNRFATLLAAFALGSATLLSACDVGGSASPTATAVSSETIAVPTAAPTDTAVSATDTAAPPTATEEAATPTEEATATQEPAEASPTTPSGGAGDYTWSQAGLAGQQINALSILPSGNNPVLAAGPQAAWKSAYDYKSWDALKVTPGGRSQSAAIISPDNFLVTGNIGCASGGPIQAFHSTDSGATWQPINGANTPLVVAAANSQLVYGTICSGIVHSTDGGATWSNFASPNAPNYDPGALAIGPDGQSLYAAYYSEGGTLKVFHTGPGDAKWVEVTPQNAGDIRGPVIFAVAPAKEGSPDQGGVYMSTGEGRLFLLSEGATEWKQISGTNPNTEQPQPDYQVTALYIDATNTEEYNKPGAIIYEARASQGTEMKGLGVFRSVDGGKTWEMLGKGLGSQVVNELVLAPQDLMIAAKTFDILIAATNDGIWTAPMPPPFH